MLPAISQSHPDPGQLERFMRGELPRSQVAALVRHLLTGCPQCREVTGRLWRSMTNVKPKPRVERQADEWRPYGDDDQRRKEGNAG